MDTARRAAPHIDRLVLSVDRLMTAREGDRLLEIGRGSGLDRLDMLPHFGDFLLAGRLTLELATARMRYVPAERVTQRIEELRRAGLVDDRASQLVATDPLRPVLEAITAARGHVAAAAWDDHGDDVARALALADRVAAAASSEHAVAAVHRSLPRPDGAAAALHQRLITLRLIRQHDHVLAWSGHGLTPPEIVAMTRLWHGESVSEDDPGAAGLVAAAIAQRDPLRLSAEGLRLREAIEDATDARAQETFDVLGGEGEELVVALTRLPDAR